MRIGRVIIATLVAALPAVPGAAWSAGAAEDRSLSGAGGTLLGVVPQREINGRDAELMTDAGIDSIRVLVPWSAIESERGSYDWTATDLLVERSADAGLTVLPFLSSEPRWAWALDGHDQCSAKCANYAPSSPPTRGAFARFTAAAVRRYGPDGSFWDEHDALPYHPVHAWQIWNEENSPFFFRPRPNAYLYAALLRRAADEIRAADPDAEVILGGVWSLDGTPGGVVGSAEYLRELYRVGDVVDSFDAIAVHPYAGGAAAVFEQIRALRRVARRAGDGSVELWVTELGWAASGKRHEPLVKGRVGQARMLRRVFGRLMRHRLELGLRGAYWYAWRDTDRGAAVCSWCAHSGLLSRAGEPRPAYRAMWALARGRG